MVLLAQTKVIQIVHRNISPVFRAMSTRPDHSVISEQLGKSTGRITLNRPKALNVINPNMVRQIYGTLRSWQDSKSLVIVRGAGEKSFCAGGDMLSFAEPGPALTNLIREVYRLIAQIESYKPDYVAIMDGVTMGTGVGISVHGRYRVATERTVLAMPETALGMFPDVGSGYFLPRLQGKLGLYLGLTGSRLKGKDLLKTGIATHYVRSKDLDALEQQLTATSNCTEVEAVLSKFNVNDSSEFSLAKNMQKINECFSGVSMESIYANLEKDGSEWALQTLKILNKMSPMSLRITKKHLDMNRYADLRSCLRIEFRVLVQRTHDSDIKEGIRALLIDRDQRPNWNPSKLCDVTDQQVDRYFGPMPDGDELVFEDEIKAMNNRSRSIGEGCHKL